MSKSKTPVIGVTVDTNEGREGELAEFKGDTVFWLKKTYTSAIEKSGALPILIPVAGSPAKAVAYLDMIDGLIISGGHFDIDPSFYGEKPRPETGPIKPDRTQMEIRLFKAARRLGVPVLGICGGLQAINIALGGDLYQHLPAQIPGALRHEQGPKPPTRPSHYVRLERKSWLGRVAGREKIKVNSTHHQGVRKLGRNVTACAIAPDGLVEGIEVDGGSLVVGVQWHPESLFENDETSRRLLKRFVAECRKNKKRHG